MKGLTRNNIAYNLHVSPHRETIQYGDKKVEYVFSSDLYRRKFIERRAETRTSIEEFLSKKYDINVEFGELSDLHLYKKIEKRGFLIYMNDLEVTWQENLSFGSSLLIRQNSIN